MKNLYREELSEIRTCSSIIGMTCRRILKHYESSTVDPDLVRYITILDSTLSRLDQHIRILEEFSKGDAGDGDGGPGEAS